MAETHQSNASSVLVPLDGSTLAEQAIPFASSLAGEGGKVLFLHVAREAEPIYSPLGDRLASKEEARELYIKAGREELAAAADRWQHMLPNLGLDVTAGDPAEEILRIAAEQGIRVIVMASQGRGALGRLTYGSVADRVARTSTIPVMVVRPRDATPETGTPVIRRLLVPLDGSDQALEALPVATDIASRLGIPVHLLRAINPAETITPYPSLAPSFPVEVYEQIERELTGEAQQSLDDAAEHARAAGISVTVAITQGSAVNAIQAAIQDGDIVVMTSHGRSGVRRWLLGSVAEKLVREAPSPVLLVPSSRPDEG